MSRSPIQIAQEAFCLAKRKLQPYSCKFSRKDYTQAQHFALLVLKRFFKTTFRGIRQIALEWSDLRRVLDLNEDSVPHWTTLEKAEKRLLKKGVLSDSSEESSIVLTASA
ncbi:MAG TPA: hypothetical protein VFC86_07270 [Planctomycetota bacterium]|nr:hypothetical protein [Planctomycetota bacterium]